MAEVKALLEKLNERIDNTEQEKQPAERYHQETGIGFAGSRGVKHQRSRTFYSENCSNVLFKPQQDILHIECANGEYLRYKGYIEVNIQTKGKHGCSQQTCLLFVVPGTEYNQGTPILLGINVLSVF